MRYLRAIIFVCFSFSVIAQTAQTLTNKDIINMTTIGLPSNLIVAKIKKTGGKFDTSPAALKELKEVGVDNAVIAMMIEGDQPKMPAQEQERPMPDRWRGMILDVTKPEEAIAKLGKPENDNIDGLRIFYVPKKWITKRQGDKIYRKLKWKQPDGLDSVELSFQNNKLVMIEIDPKQEPAAVALSNIYGSQFTPIIGGLNEAFFPQDFERNQGKIYPKRYPAVYYIVSTSERSFIGGMVANNSFGEILKQSVGGTDTDGMPGKVSRIQIVSRTLENRDGADALK